MNSAVDPVAVLLSVAETAQRFTPGAAANRFALAVQQYLNGEVSFDRALGLQCPEQNGRSPRNRYLLARRDDHLREAATSCGGSIPRLAKEIRNFETRTWRRWQDLNAPPPAATELQRILFEAFRLDVGVPTTRQLYRICDMNAA